MTIENIAPLEYVSISAIEIKRIPRKSSFDFIILSRKYKIRITLTVNRYRPRKFAFKKKPAILMVGLSELEENPIRPALKKA
ncbi:MAG: hypothetical protein SV062_00495 [Thermodesulfobacteriota bacterium]|nr:hypothetical protein [Thermodesulfobacteriota bacterium]